MRRHAPGRSFADMGCMYNANGKIAFLSEEVAAASVTAFDGSPESEEYLAEHRRRSSKVRFVRGDMHDPDAIAAVGEHDFVWCTGVIYHSPNPMLLIERLASITGDLLLLGSLTIPEVPGIEQACVFYPQLDDAGRGPYRSIWKVEAIGISTPFEPGPERRSYNYWWGITPSALVAMVKTAGFEVLECHRYNAFDTDVLARRPARTG